MALGTLSIDIEARLASLEQGLEGAVRANQRAAQRVDRVWSTAGASLRGAMAGAVASISVGAISAFARQLVDGVDKLNDLSDATGSTVENISALEDVARRTGGSVDQVGDILVRFNKVLADAKPGSDAARALDALGLSAKELRAQDPSEALRRTAVALAGFADDGNKARLVQELFGKSIKEAAPFLNDLARAGQLNATVTSEQAREAEKFNQQLAALSRNFENLSRSVLGRALPALNQFLALMASAANGPGISGVLTDRFMGRGTKESFDFYKAELDAIDAKIKGLRDGPKLSSFNPQRIAQLEQDRKKVEQFLDVYRALLNEGSGGAGRGYVNPVADKPRLPEVVPGAKGGDMATAARKFEDYADSIKASIGKLAEDTQTVKLAKMRDQLKALDDLVSKGFDPQIAREIRTALQGVDTVEIPADDLKRMADVMQLIAQTPSAKLGEIVDLEEKLAEAFARGAITSSQYEEALVLLEDRFDALSDPVKQALDEMSTFAEQAQRNIQTALGDTLSRTLRGDFDGIADLWAGMLARMVSEALAVDLNNAIFGGAKAGGIGDLVSGFSALLGLSSGGAFGAGGVRMYANGDVFSRATGFAHAGGLGVLGEAGPEAVMPLARGLDGKLGVRSQGGGAVVVQQTINVGQGVTHEQLRRAMFEARAGAVAATKAQISQSVRRDGVFA